MNPVVISVLVMLGLSLAKLNVILALLVAALTGGIVGGVGIFESIEILIGGMGDSAETALSYILLGAFAVAVQKTGIVSLLSNKLIDVLSDMKKVLILVIAAFSILSQNAIPVHIAFVPILIPPLLGLFNKLKIDRRAVATALVFGLKAPYIAIPYGFGLMYHGIIQDEMAANGLEVSLNQIASILWVPGVIMLLGLLVAVFITYNQDREYTNDFDYENLSNNNEEKDLNWTLDHTVTIVAMLAALVVQYFYELLPLAALVALFIMFIGRSISWLELDELIDSGVSMMGFIAFVMLVASGYADLLEATGGIDEIIVWVEGIVGTNQFLGALLMLLVGLVITMGIGTSFGTIPIIAAIYVPMAQVLGFSPLGIILLIGTAGALGDAGSPASDTTLGTTVGLDVDGQHDHVWDTCVPTFLHFDIPLIFLTSVAILFL